MKSQHYILTLYALTAKHTGIFYPGVTRTTMLLNIIFFIKLLGIESRIVEFDLPLIGGLL